MDRGGLPALLLAASLGRADLVSLLLDQRADPASVAPGGDTALHLAARAGSSECVEMLLSSGANVTATNRAGRTALHTAAVAGQAGAVTALLRTLPGLADKMDRAGATPLLLHCQSGQATAQLCTLLTTKRALGLQDSAGWDPVAALTVTMPGPSRLPALATLLRAGAPAGDTALQVAVAGRDWEAAALLVRAGARLQPGPDYVSLALQHGQYSLASCLLAAGASPSRLAALPAPAAAWLSSRKHSTATLKGHATNIDIKDPAEVSKPKARPSAPTIATFVTEAAGNVPTCGAAGACQPALYLQCGDPCAAAALCLLPVGIINSDLTL